MFWYLGRGKLLVLFLLVGIAVSSFGQSPDAQRAVELEQEGLWEDAAAAWHQVIAANPRDAAAIASLGLVLSHEEKYSEAAEAYRRALKLNPKLPGVELNLGLAEFKQSHLREAIPPFQAALREQPSNLQARTLLGMTYYGTGQFAQAVPLLQYAVTRSPQNAELRGVLAQACLHARQFNCTLEQYKAILNANPNSAQAHILAAEADDGLNRTDDAVAEFEAAIKVAPQEPNVHFGLGYLLWKQHKYPEAEKEFTQELANEPNHAQAAAYLGDTQLKLGRNADAEGTLEKAVQMPGAPRLAWVDLGTVLADEHKNDAAATALDHAIQMDPNQVDAHWRLARLYQSEGRGEQARAEFAKASALHQKEDQSLVQQMTPQK